MKEERKGIVTAGKTDKGIDIIDNIPLYINCIKRKVAILEKQLLKSNRFEILTRAEELKSMIDAVKICG